VPLRAFGFPLSARKKLMNSPRLLLGLGVFLMLLGVILPFLMVIQLLESTFFLNFFSWGASVAGLAFGTIGFALYSRDRRE
jgi:membrane associated rhomboid family serine protease